jgi:hypothetical protein
MLPVCLLHGHVPFWDACSGPAASTACAPLLSQIAAPTATAARESHAIECPPARPFCCFVRSAADAAADDPVADPNTNVSRGCAATSAPPPPPPPSPPLSAPAPTTPLPSPPIRRPAPFPARPLGVMPAFVLYLVRCAYIARGPIDSPRRAVRILQSTSTAACWAGAHARTHARTLRQARG